MEPSNCQKQCKSLPKKRPKDTAISDLHKDYCTSFCKYCTWELIKFTVKQNTCITFPGTCQTDFQVTLQHLAADGGQAVTVTQGCSDLMSLLGQKQALEQGWSSGMQWWEAAKGPEKLLGFERSLV